MKQKQTTISSLDILILLKIISLGENKWFQTDIAETLGISQSEVSKFPRSLKFATSK